MLAMILTILCSSMLSVFMRMSEGKAKGKMTVLYMNYFTCIVLAASFTNCEQVHNCAMEGCHAVTVSREIFKASISHSMTDVAVAGFTRDWKDLYGDKTILDF